MRKRILVLFLFCAVTCAGVWALVRYTDVRRSRLFQSVNDAAGSATNNVDPWTLAVEKVKAERADANVAVETPPELKHYSERYWFLATQVAEIEKNKVHLCQDFLDLATMIQRGEMISLPAVTDTYILYGVGQRADEAEFSTFEDTQNTDLDSEAKLSVEKRANPEGYEALQALAKNFNGRSYDLNNPADRQALKINMLSALRPQAVEIMKAVAAAYQRQFDRPLPVSSLVRPEQYQHALRRVNRNAVVIEAPPHATGLAFDIDYRYMGGAEQTFVMGELARLKNEGRIEVIRERAANYHVFVFVNGTRPSDDLITASLEKAGAPVEQTHHAEAKPTKSKVKAKATKRQNKQRRRRR